MPRFAIRSDFNSIKDAYEALKETVQKLQSHSLTNLTELHYGIVLRGATDVLTDEYRDILPSYSSVAIFIKKEKLTDMLLIRAHLKELEKTEDKLKKMHGQQHNDD